MKKLFITVLTATAASASCLQALPVGNPSDASLLIDGILWEGTSSDPCDPCATWCDAVSVRLGFYGDYVFDRFLKTSIANPGAGATVNVAADQDMLNSELYTNSGLIVFNIWDRLDVFGTLGATKALIKGTSQAFNLNNTYVPVTDPVTTPVLPADIININDGLVSIDTETGFSWSIGARGSLWECGCATLGAEVQYAQSKPNVDHISVESSLASFQVDNPDLKARYKEWQVGLGLSYRINMLTPYVGLKWSKADVKMDNAIVRQSAESQLLNPASADAPAAAVPPATPAGGAPADSLNNCGITLNKLKSRRSCGLAVGTTLVDADKLSVTVEGRFCDEKAVSVNSLFRF